MAKAASKAFAGFPYDTYGLSGNSFFSAPGPYNLVGIVQKCPNL
jgi:hypothetical protein